MNSREIVEGAHKLQGQQSVERLFGAISGWCGRSVAEIFALRGKGEKLEGCRNKVKGAYAFIVALRIDYKQVAVCSLL